MKKQIDDLKVGNFVVLTLRNGQEVTGRITYIDYNLKMADLKAFEGTTYIIDNADTFELWQDRIEDKTESVRKVRIKDLSLGDTIQILNGKLPLEGKVTTISDLLAIVEIPIVGYRFISDESDFKRIRKAIKPLDPNKWLEKATKENSEKTKSVLESGLGVSKPATKYNQSNDVQQRKRNEQNTKPDYYQFDDFEMYEIVEAICKHYNPVVAAWIGQAIQYIGRAPRKNGKEDIGKARDMIEQAFKSWDK